MLNQRSDRSLMKNHLLPDAVHRIMAVFVSVLLLSAPDAAAYYSTGVKIAQGAEANSQDVNRAAAQRAYAVDDEILPGDAQRRAKASGGTESGAGGNVDADRVEIALLLGSFRASRRVELGSTDIAALRTLVSIKNCCN